MAIIRRTALIEVPVEITRSRCGRMAEVQLLLGGREDSALKLRQIEELAWGGETPETEPRLTLSLAPLAGQSTWMVWLFDLPEAGTATNLRDAAQALGEFARGVADELERLADPDCNGHEEDSVSR